MGSKSMHPASSKIIQTNNRGDHEPFVSITEKIKLTKKQYEVLNIICNTYEESISQYLQEALVEAMRFDIEEGNFSNALLEKIHGEDSKKANTSPSDSPAPFAPDLVNSDQDLLKKLQTQI